MKFHVFFIAFLAVACGSPTLENGSEVNERISGTGSESWQDTAIVNKTLNAPNAVRVNLETNFVTYYENGTPMAKWMVATARQGKETPKGIFAIHWKDVCPSWSLNGRSAAGCAENNPLGKKALWFFEGGVYGLHGVDLANIKSVTSRNTQDRYRSSGCIRNHPENIDWLFDKVSEGTPVVVGSWNTDPNVVDCSGNAAACSKSTPASGGGDSLLPLSTPQWCAINVSEDGLANVRSQPSTSGEIVSSLDRQSRVQVIQKISGQAVNGSTDWYSVKYTLGGPKSGFIHSSLLDCTR